MTYNDIEYAIVTALGFGLKGQHALDWIKKEFGYKDEDLPSIATYWRHLGRLESQFAGELEKLAHNIVEKHMARLHMFYRLRTKLMTALEEEDKPANVARIISVIDKHEVLTSQLEALSRKYYEKHMKELLANPPSALQMVTV